MTSKRRIKGPIVTATWRDVPVLPDERVTYRRLLSARPSYVVRLPRKKG